MPIRRSAPATCLLRPARARGARAPTPVPREVLQQLLDASCSKLQFEGYPYDPIPERRVAQAVTIRLTAVAARRLHVAAQGLDRRPRRAARKQDVLDAIRRMGVLQIDTISVIARSPYMVLFSRLGAYEQCWLDELLAEGRLFEYWAHEASFLPIEDFALMRHRMLDPHGMGWKFRADWIAKHRGELDNVIAHLRASGAARSADFERRDGAAAGWWEWKPEKRALESLFTM